MHINAKKIALGGLLLAMTEIFLLLGSVIEMNTLFLLAAASYFIGIMIREAGMGTGIAFYIAGVLLGILLTPNIFYVCSYAAMGFYIVATEAGWRAVGKLTGEKKRLTLFWLIKFLAFNLVFTVVLLFFGKVLFLKKMTTLLWVGVAAAGQVGWLLYDRAYEWTQIHLWSKMRNRLGNP